MKYVEAFSATAILRTLAILSAGLSIALALAFFLGGDERIKAKAYWVVSQTGGSVTWGIIFLFAGALMVLSARRSFMALRVAAWVSAGAYLILAIAFTASAAKFATANLTAPVVYGWLGFAHVYYATCIGEQIALERKVCEDG